MGRVILWTFIYQLTKETLSQFPRVCQQSSGRDKQAQTPVSLVELFLWAFFSFGSSKALWRESRRDPMEQGLLHLPTKK